MAFYICNKNASKNFLVNLVKNGPLKTAFLDLLALTNTIVVPSIFLVYTCIELIL